VSGRILKQKQIEDVRLNRDDEDSRGEAARWGKWGGKGMKLGRCFGAFSPPPPSTPTPTPYSVQVTIPRQCQGQGWSWHVCKLNQIKFCPKINKYRPIVDLGIQSLGTEGVTS
jgi:hypothetical protein